MITCLAQFRWACAGLRPQISSPSEAGDICGDIAQCHQATISAGLGGCPFAPGASGNVASEDVIHMLHEMGIDTGIDLLKAMDTARLAAGFVGHPAASAVLKAGRCVDLVKEKAQGQNNK